VAISNCPSLFDIFICFTQQTNKVNIIKIISLQPTKPYYQSCLRTLQHLVCACVLVYAKYVGRDVQVGQFICNYSIKNKSFSCVIEYCLFSTNLLVAKCLAVGYWMPMLLCVECEEVVKENACENSAEDKETYVLEVAVGAS